MLGTYKSTELWRHPSFLIVCSLIRVGFLQHNLPLQTDPHFAGVAPEPDSTEDSFGTGPDPIRSTSSPVRRCSHPVTGSPKDAVEAATRRSSEGHSYRQINKGKNVWQSCKSSLLGSQSYIKHNLCKCQLFFLYLI